MSNNSLSSRLLQNLVQAANTGIVVTDAKLKDNPIIFANDAFYAMTGYGPDETIGFNCRFLQGKDVAQREIDVIRQSVRNAEPCKVVLKNYRKDKTPFWNELYVTPYFDEQGELTHFFGVQHDVTDVVEQRLEKDMFNAGVLHDIKSPLMGQARILEYMAKQSTSGELEGVSSLMLQTLKDSMHLVSDTLDLYKLENELVVPNLSTVSAKTFIQSVIDSVKDDARDKRIQLHCLQPEGDHQVTFDTSMVFRALKNLVENAVCYSQPGKDIWILSSANDSAQMIAVVDHGSGLPTQVVKQFEHDSAAPSVLHSAFESPTKHKSSLGLLACGQIMRAHNGKLNLIKSDRFGTEFALTFPMYTLAQRSGNLPVK